MFASGTYLDTSRFRVLLAERLHINAQSMHGFIVGEHGDSSVALWSGVNVAGMSLQEMAKSNAEYAQQSRDEIANVHQQVKDAAYEVISLKGYTNWAIGTSFN